VQPFTVSLTARLPSLSSKPEPLIPQAVESASCRLAELEAEPRAGKGEKLELELELELESN
jgi:hypothetical protein